MSSPAPTAEPALSQGLNGRLTMIQGEDAQEYLDLINGLIAEHQPATATESSLVVRMGQSLWMAQRALALQSLLVMNNPEPDEKRLAVYIRFQTTHDRAFSKSLSDLLKLRQERRREAQEFVSQNHKTELHQAKLRHLNAKSEDLELNSEVRRIVEAPLPGTLLFTQAPAARAASAA